ncbi:hypothetical protein LTR62_003601 [Meristemomyces frigidus]|uniref:Uncharacterized protein n=1 Tax=Meristemomyces frigidus TaxID=1508187 RepID=A0AAN7YGT2_9PEZI|nr:hypothetical protein LTR62_003601 [Meristemomyces frigidus]
MIRPRLRPTLSRRNKYIGIAPQAEKKLAREVRHGANDLRRLVGQCRTIRGIPISFAQMSSLYSKGHANFLDVIVDNLEHCEPEANPLEQIPRKSILSALVQDEDQDEDEDEIENEDDSGSDTDSSEDSWQDESDDEEHALTHTEAVIDLAKLVREGVTASLVQTSIDYFTPERHGKPSLDQASRTSYEKKAEVVITTTTAISPLSDASDDLLLGSIDGRDHDFEQEAVPSRIPGS